MALEGPPEATAARTRGCRSGSTTPSPATSGSSRATGCPRATAGRWSGRSPSTPTPRSSACSRRATGSPARRRCAARRSCWPRCRTRPGTGSTSTRRAETLGVDRADLTELLIEGRQKYSSIFNYPTLTYADVGVIGWLVDGAAICNQVPLCRSSYGPYARAMIRICKEESFHQRQGYELLMTMMRGTDGPARDGAGRGRPLLVAVADDVRPARRRLAQHRAVDGLGHQAAHQRRAAPAVRRHDASRRPRGSASPCPTRDLRWNEERGHYDFGAAGLGRVHAGDPGQRPLQRRADRPPPRAHEDGAWVREAAARLRGQAASEPTREEARHERARMTAGRVAALRGVRARQARPEPRARRLAARRRRRDGAAPRARRLHPPQRGRQHLGGALDAHHRVEPATRRTRSSRPAGDKVYRHPTFYDIPDDVPHM